MEIVVPQEYKSLYTEGGIVKIPSSVLSQRATEVTKFNKALSNKANKMIQTMLKARGLGLAAPQIAWGKRVMIVRSYTLKPKIIINPEILESAGEITTEEGCLSIPGLYGNVTRPSYIHATGVDVNGERFELKLDALGSVVFQHELDHLNGVLFTERADPASFNWKWPQKTSLNMS